jgi:hypothetical protein
MEQNIRDEYTAEVPFSLPLSLIDSIGEAQLTSAKLSSIDDNLRKLRSVTEPSIDTGGAKIIAQSTRDFFQQQLVDIHEKMVYEVYRSFLSSDLRDEELIFFDSLFRDVDPNRGFDFVKANQEVDNFRKLQAKTNVIFPKSMADPDTLVDAGTLLDSPTVSLYFDRDEHTLTAKMVILFEVDNPLIKTWYETQFVTEDSVVTRP